MIRRQRHRLIGWYLAGDMIGITITYFYAYIFRFYGYFIPVSPEKGIPPIEPYIWVFPLFLFTHLIIFFIQGFYKTRLKRTGFDDFFHIAVNAGLTILIALGVLNYLYAYSQGAAPLFQMTFKISHGFLGVYFVGLVFVLLFLRNQIYYYKKRRYARGMDLQNVLIVGAGKMGRTVAQKLIHYKDLGFKVKGFLDDDHKPGERVEVNGGTKVLGSLDALDSAIEEHEISDVYVALDLNNYSRILKTLKVVNKHAVNVRLIPDLFQLLTLRARVEDLDGFPVISVDEPPMRGPMILIKRTVDIVVSSLVLILLSPFLISIGCLIKRTSPGPVLYHQERIGLDGKKFTMHKFRTMIHDAEHRTGPMMCQPNDPRITKIGRFLRRFSIDEIPQLWNVLKGEMSLVGPRPEREVFVKQFREKLPKYMLRHKVKSGLTGWAQVHGLRQDCDFDKRLEYDFYYIQNWSFLLDLQILWMTLRKKGFIDKTV
jgi:exopolysaccharide biosynthesis polyprenyl glycosylphosphotransferase